MPETPAPEGRTRPHDMKRSEVPGPVVRFVVDDPGVVGSGALVGAYIDNPERADEHARNIRGVVVGLPVVADHRDKPTRVEDDAREGQICDEERESTLAEFERFTINRARLTVQQTVNACFVSADRAELYEEFRERIERRVREQTLREAADLLDSKPLHCEEHGSVTCTECPVGSDHLRVWADRIARGEAR